MSPLLQVSEAYCSVVGLVMSISWFIYLIYMYIKPILLPLGRHSKWEPEKRWGFAQFTHQADVRLVDELSLAQPCAPVAKTTHRHSGLHWDEHHQPAKGADPTLVSPIWRTVTSSGLPSRHTGVWSLLVLGNTPSQVGLRKVLSHLL